MHKVALKALQVLRKKNEHDLCLYEAADAGYSYRRQWVTHSYVLKTMFLHEWFEFPKVSFWSENKLEDRIKSILERIRSSLKSKDIRSFWVPGYKLFNFRARKSTLTKVCEEKLTHLLQNLTLQSQNCINDQL